MKGVMATDWSEASVRLANLEAKMDKLLDLFSEIATLRDRLTLKTIKDENKDLKKAAENTMDELQELKPSLAIYAFDKQKTAKRCKT